MGNLQSTFASPPTTSSLVVVPSRCRFHAGEPITGFVHVHVFGVPLAGVLGLHFVGEERSYWVTVSQASETFERDGVSVSESRQVATEHGGAQQLVKLSVPLWGHLGQGPLPPGQYSFPFSFGLPQGLPGR